MATRIHPKNVHEKSPKNVHEMSPKKRTSRGQKCPRNVTKSVHEMSPIMSTRCLPPVSTTPIMAKGCRQCLSLSVVQLKGRYVWAWWFTVFIKPDNLESHYDWLSTYSLSRSNSANSQKKTHALKDEHLKYCTYINATVNVAEYISM